MFSLGYQELLLIAVVALIVISPQRLPEALRTFGGMVAKFRRAANELQREIESATHEVERADDKNLPPSPLAGRSIGRGEFEREVRSGLERKEAAALDAEISAPPKETP